MRIKYLGTAAAEGWPGIFCRCAACAEARATGGRNIRTRSQALVDGELLVDFPPDSYLHALSGGVDLPAVRDVVFTHSHQDHCYLDDLLLRSETFAKELGPKLRLHGNRRVQARFEAAAAAFAHFSPLDVLKYEYLSPYVPAAVGNHVVTPIPAVHDRGEDCYVYLIEGGGKRMLYGNDTGLLSDEAFGFLSGKRLDLASLDCTMVGLRDGKNHMGIEDCAEFRDRLAALGCVDAGTALVVTHFSHCGGLMHGAIAELAGRHGFRAAYDGFELEF